MEVRRWGTLGAALAALLGAAACVPVGKQDAVRRVDAALRRPGVRTGALAVSSAKPRISGPTSPSLPSAPVAPASLRVVVDVAARRAALLAPPAAAARIGPGPDGSFPPIALFDGHTLYVRAFDAAAVGARPWVAVDLDHAIGQQTTSTDALTRPRTLGDLALVSPIDLLDLGRGLLTGSVTATDRGRLSGRTSIDKEVRARHLDPSAADPLRHRLAAFAATDDINPMRVDLSGDGQVQHLSVDLVGRPEYGVQVRTTFALDLDATPTASLPSTPAAADVVRVDDLGEVRNALDAWATSPGAGAGA